MRFYNKCWGSEAERMSYTQHFCKKQKTNLSRENINRFENASRKPGIDAIVDIANALGVSIEDLLVDSLEHPISSTESEIHKII